MSDTIIWNRVEPVPITGRYRLITFPRSFDATRGKLSYEDRQSRSKEHILPRDHPLTRRIETIVERILSANDLGVLFIPSVDGWPTEETQSAAADSTKWTLTVIDDPDTPSAAASNGDAFP